MVDLGRGASLLAEAVPEHLVLAELAPQHLERDDLAVGADRLEDETHSPLAEERLEAVFAETVAALQLPGRRSPWFPHGPQDMQHRRTTDALPLSEGGLGLRA